MIIAIIPAKGNSVGLPRKNAKRFFDKSLTELAIESANIDLIDRIFVTTQDEEIVQQTVMYELDNAVSDVAARKVVAIIRPPALLGDDVQVDEVALYTLRQIEVLLPQEMITDVVVLQPTSPLRKAWHVREALQSYLNQNIIEEEAIPMLSVYKSSKYAYQSDYIGDRLTPIDHDPRYRLGRQEATSNIYVENGAIYIAPADFLKKQKTFRSFNPFFYEMSEAQSIEVDTQLDLDLAEQYYRSMVNDRNSG